MILKQQEYLETRKNYYLSNNLNTLVIMLFLLVDGINRNIKFAHKILFLKELKHKKSFATYFTVLKKIKNSLTE